MRLSSKVQYGLQALLDLAERFGAGPVPLAAIAERQGLSEYYLEQLAGTLRKAGLIESVRGVQGGYLLARPPREILVSEVVAALEGPSSLIGAKAKDGDLSGTDEESGGAAGVTPETAVIREVWEEAARQVTRVLAGVTLADLAERVRILAGNDPMYFI